MPGLNFKHLGRVVGPQPAPTRMGTAYCHSLPAQVTRSGLAAVSGAVCWLDVLCRLIFVFELWQALCPSPAIYSKSGQALVSQCITCPNGTCPDSTYGAALPWPCPDDTYTVWLDTQEVEGSHSCLKLLTSVVNWTTANASCAALGARAHLLTSKQVRGNTIGSSILLPVLFSLPNERLRCPA